MRARFQPERIPQYLLLPGTWLVLFAALTLGLQLTRLGRDQGFSGPALVAGGALIASLLTLLVWRLRAARAVSRENQERMQRQLAAVVDLNRLLLSAGDEGELVDQALPIFARLTGALGCSFTPLDEWGQPVQAFTYGELPPPVLRGWAEHLASQPVRETCQACSEHHSLAGGLCPLQQSPLPGAFNIFCQPIWRNERMVGLLNLYLPVGEDLRGDDQQLVTGMLHQISLSIENLRLRDQELNTLRQLQFNRSQQADVKTLLGNVLDGLRDALDIDLVALDVRAVGDSLPPFRLALHPPGQAGDEDLEALFRQSYSSPDDMPDPEAPGWQYLERVPLRLPDGPVVGMLLAGWLRQVTVGERQRGLISTVAAQSALLVEGERNRRSLELRSVLQERTRLAREIHDGLAQTLAFLKLNAAQMQAYLAQGDLARLENALIKNHQVLTDTYQETRQAIDHLRLSPEAGMEAWIEQICEDFEQTSGLTVVRERQPQEMELPAEVQAQVMRILQEALNNVRKHAGARQVQVGMRTWQGDWLLEVRDDGNGFSPEELSDLTRHGLRGMQERAELIGADFQIESRPGAGTTVKLRLPLNMGDGQP